MLNSELNSKKVLFLMTGSIACYKACQVLSRLTQAGCEVQVVASKSALQFVGAPTLEGLTGKPVLSDLWQEGRMMDHIHLQRWADLIVVAPASANYINKIAAGLADDLVSTIFLAHDFKKPFLLTPAMNTAMYLHPITQSSIQKLSSLGVEILESASGVLACGEVGSGRLLEPDLIQAEIESRLLAANHKNGQKILVTAGGTQEAIDGVRVLTNKSTGQTGATIADTLFEQGYDVHLLTAESAVHPKNKIKTENFVSFEDLQTKFKNILSSNDFTAVIHAAAVSDFSILNAKTGKWSSDEEFSLQFKKNPKLINEIRNWSRNKEIRILAFKMTAFADEKTIQKAVHKVFSESNADVVIQNDTREIDWKLKRHAFHWYTPGQNPKNISSSHDLALEISSLLGGSL